MQIANNNTRAIRNRYNRIAPFYDFMEDLVEKTLYRKWRKLLWSKVEGNKILEIGVGTGNNIPYYPVNAEITAIDFSERMLGHAIEKAKKQGLIIDLQPMDVQNLTFEDDTFDTTVATFVFCSVPDPKKGLREIARVCKPGGRILLLEHVLSANRIVASFMNLVNPMVVRTMGVNINRRTVENVTESGIKIENVTELAAGIFKLIEASKTGSYSENVKTSINSDNRS